MRTKGSVLCLISAVALVAAAPGDLTSSSPVADAAQAKDLETVRGLLQAGGDVNAAQGDGMTALHWAAISNDAEMTDVLLYAGANVKATTRLGGYTPLILAARGGHAEIVGALLKAGAAAKDQSTTGVTALMLASASGSEGAARLLLDGGADVNARETTRGQTALMFASAYDRGAVTKLLLERGADAKVATNLVDVPALDKKMEEDFVKHMKSLREARQKEAAEKAAAESGATASPSGEEDTEEEAKDAAKDEGGKNVFAKLFGWASSGKDKEKKKDEKDDRRRFRRTPYGQLVGMQGGMTALLLAARQGNTEAVKALLEGGADVNQVSEANHTSPLLIATMNGHFDLARYLLEQGADPNLASEPANVTPLYSALNLQWAPFAGYPQPTAQLQQKTTYLELLKALLDRGAEPNVRLKKKVWFTSYNFDHSGIDETGATPFWRAAYGLDVPAMKLLRDYGADPGIPTANPGFRPRIERQAGREFKDVSGLPPVPIGGPALTPLHAAAGAGFGEGFAANDYHGHPAGFLNAVTYLVEECGADVNARDHEGSTPLHHAAARGDVEVIRYLVSKGADVTAINREGQSTADMANGPVQRIQPWPEALDLLVSLGATNHNKCVSC